MKKLLSITVLLLGTNAFANDIENCVASKVNEWRNSQTKIPMSDTETVEMGACRRWNGCSDNWSKKRAIVSAEDGYELLAETVATSQRAGANPKNNNYVRRLPDVTANIKSQFMNRTYLKSVSVEVACHRRGSPGRAGCDMSGSISAQQVKLISNEQLLQFAGACFSQSSN